MNIASYIRNVLDSWGSHCRAVQLAASQRREAEAILRMEEVAAQAQDLRRNVSKYLDQDDPLQALLADVYEDRDKLRR